MSDIAGAREYLAGALKNLSLLSEVFPDEINPIAQQINCALDRMTRVYTKAPIRRGMKMTPQLTKNVEEFLTRPEAESMTDTEIAERVLGHACAAGRVSEIRRRICKR